MSSVSFTSHPNLLKLLTAYKTLEGTSAEDPNESLCATALHPATPAGQLITELQSLPKEGEHTAFQMKCKRDSPSHTMRNRLGANISF